VSTNGRVDDNRNLNDQERELVQKLLADPLSFPIEFKQWLRSYLEASDITLSKGNIHGLQDKHMWWEDVGTSGGGPGGGGIQFDTDPQDGDWLHINTTGAGGSSGDGMALFADNSIYIKSNNNIALQDNGGGGIYLTSRAGPVGGSYIGIQADGEIGMIGDVIVLRSTGHNIEIQSSGTIWTTFFWDKGVSIRLGAASSFAIGVFGSSTDLLEVRGDGTLHIPAGATWIADL
jgi:hypothetical protein